jgi:hypothetical protein
MRLQPGGVIGDQRVGGGVALVEAVAGELVDQVEQLVGLARLDVLAAQPSTKRARWASISPGSSCPSRGAAGRLRRGCSRPAPARPASPVPGRRRCRRFPSARLRAAGADIRSAPRGVLAVAEQRDVVHRTRPVERHQRDDVAEAGRPNRRQRPPHAFGFQLEHADRVAALEQLVDLWVVPLQRGDNRPRRPAWRAAAGLPSAPTGS